MDLCLANVTKQKQKQKTHTHIESKKYELIEWAREERMYLYNIAPMHDCRLIVNLNYMLYGHNHHQSALYKHTHTKTHSTEKERHWQTHSQRTIRNVGELDGNHKKV